MEEEVAVVKVVLEVEVLAVQVTPLLPKGNMCVPRIGDA